MKRKVIIVRILKALNGVAMILAVASVQSTCVWVHHQPKIPEGLKEESKHV